MATEKRAMSTTAKVITGLIYLLAIGLLIGVIYMNLHTGSDTEEATTAYQGSTNAATVSTTADLPYNAAASDKYANLEPVYKVGEVSIEKDGFDIWSAFVDGRKVSNYTGVAKNANGWFFVRDGEVDFHYNGIAGNELGNWYVKKGKVDFSYTGTYTVNNTNYKIVEGQVIE